MADAYGGVVGHWRAHVTGSIISQDNGSVTIRATTYFQAVDGWSYSSLGGSFNASVAGQAASGSTSGGISVGANGQQNIASKDVRISKNHGSQNIKFNGAISINGYAAGSSSAGGSIAIGAKPSYTVWYNANGGSGAPGSQTKWYGEVLSLSKTKPTRTNYQFLGWGTASGDSTVNYNPGSLYGSDQNITLYAIWKLSLVAPTIDSMTVYRCDSSGNSSDNGEYVKVTCAWHVDTKADTSNVGVTLAIAYDSTTDSNNLTGTSGTFTKIYSSVSASTSHQFSATLTDKHMSVKSSRYIGPSYFIIDINADGSGVGIGQAAPSKGIAVCGTFFANSLDGLPTTAADVGPKGTKAIVAGLDYVFDGVGTWSRATPRIYIISRVFNVTTGLHGYLLISESDLTSILGMAWSNDKCSASAMETDMTNLTSIKLDHSPEGLNMRANSNYSGLVRINITIFDPR